MDNLNLLYQKKGWIFISVILFFFFGFVLFPLEENATGPALLSRCHDMKCFAYYSFSHHSLFLFAFLMALPFPSLFFFSSFYLPCKPQLVLNGLYT